MVLDSLGVGEAKDARNYGDNGCNTLGNIKNNYDLFVPNLAKIGFLDTLTMEEDDKTEDQKQPVSEETKEEVIEEEDEEEIDDDEYDDDDYDDID